MYRTHQGSFFDAKELAQPQNMGKLENKKNNEAKEFNRRFSTFGLEFNSQLKLDIIKIMKPQANIMLPRGQALVEDTRIKYLRKNENTLSLAQTL